MLGASSVKPIKADAVGEASTAAFPDPHHMRRFSDTFRGLGFYKAQYENP